VQNLNEQVEAMQDVASEEFHKKDILLVKMIEERGKNKDKVKEYKDMLVIKDSDIQMRERKERELTEYIQMKEVQIKHLLVSEGKSNAYI
jgi:hypothetical protein